MSDGPTPFDLNAAWLRKARGDMRAFVEGFAVRMEGAIPSQVTVERERDGFFSKTSHVVKVSIATERDVFVLDYARSHLTARRMKSVRGVTLKSEHMPVPDWLAALDQEIRLLADEASSAHTVLHDLLMS